MTTTPTPSTGAQPDGVSAVRIAGAALLAVGISGLVIGVGIGIRTTAVQGPSWKGGMGLIALGVGFVMSWAGVSRVTHGLRAPVRLGVSVLLVLGAALSVWTLAPGVIATNVPPTPTGLSPEDYGMSVEDVVFATTDGVEIAAWYVPSRSGLAVVLRHGAGTNASSVLPHAQVLARNGYGVLITDARGHGRSGGVAMDFGWYGNLDIAAALSYLRTRPDVDPTGVAVVGMSMGGEEAIGAFGADPRVAAVVAEGATARTDADKSWLSDVYGIRGWIQQRLEWVQYTFTDLLTPASKPESLASSASRAAPRPLLLIAGGETPDEMNAASHIQRGGNVAVWVVPGAGHVAGIETAPDEWEQRVIGFLDAALTG